MREPALRWLYSELPELTAAGILSEDAARRIRDHYGPVPEGGRTNLVTAVLGTIGAVLIGAGVLLLVAHNWDQISRGGRTALVMALLLGAQAGALFALRRRPSSPAWCEGSAALLTAAVGASQALVAQTYHIPGDWPGFLLLWAVLVLPLAYLLDSAVAAAAFWVLITMRAASAGDATFWVLAAAGAPWVVGLARRGDRGWRAALVVPGAALALCVGGLFASAVSAFQELWMLHVTGVLAGLHAATGRDAVPLTPWRRRLRFLTTVGLGTTALVLTYVYSSTSARGPLVGAEAWRESRAVIALGLGAAAGLWGVASGLRAVDERQWGNAGARLAWPVFVAIWLLGGAKAWWGANLYLAALGATTLAAGLRAHELLGANLGLALIAGLALARFFDGDLSFVARGLGFIAVGAGFLVLNLYLVRRDGRRR